MQTLTMGAPGCVFLGCDFASILQLAWGIWPFSTLLSFLYDHCEIPDEIYDAYNGVIE